MSKHKQPKSKKVRFNDQIKIHEIPNTASKSYSDLPKRNPMMDFANNRWSTRSKPLIIPVVTSPNTTTD